MKLQSHDVGKRQVRLVDEETGATLATGILKGLNFGIGEDRRSNVSEASVALDLPAKPSENCPTCQQPLPPAAAKMLADFDQQLEAGNPFRRVTTTLTTQELQEVADRIATRFDYAKPVSKTMLVQVAQEATAELGIECEARIEGTTLAINVRAEPDSGVMPVKVVGRIAHV